jgi:hypothetical protein
MLVKHHINASLNWIETRKLNEREKNTLLDDMCWILMNRVIIFMNQKMNRN